jgi:signal transduction histidine kinase/ActR/RegA family two-component response regulator
MKPRLPFFNWSFPALLESEVALFDRARLRILFVIILFSIAKTILVVCIAGAYGQDLQLIRAVIICVVYLVLLKLLLAGKVYMQPIVHVMINMGLILIWTSVFLTTRSVNIATLQFVFMVMVSSFYFLNRVQGVIYSGVAALPVVAVLLFPVLATGSTPFIELVPVGYASVVVLNFITLIIAIYLYQSAFSETLRETKALAQTKSDFLSTMSHELRTPLNSVIGLTELLATDPHTEDQKEKLDALAFSATSLHSLINDILDFSKLESGKLELEQIRLNVGDLIERVASGLRVQAVEKGLDLRVVVDESVRKTFVIGDPTRLSQVLFNLAGNAVKFTHEGVVTITANTLDLNEDEIALRFVIADTGIGIPKEKQRQIFEPFVQGSGDTTRNYGGTGLGLSIVSRLLLMMGSRMSLQSETGKGSAFSFELRMKRDVSAENPEVEDANAVTDLSGIRMLVAEDNPMNIFLIRKLCARWKIEPDIAENGNEAFHKATTAGYDIILMDIHMPGMDGYETVRKLRKAGGMNAEIPVIALTASVSGNINELIREAGMNDYLRKPFDATELYTKIRAMVKVQ